MHQKPSMMAYSKILETLDLFHLTREASSGLIKGDDSMFAVLNLTMGKRHQWATAA